MGGIKGSIILFLSLLMPSSSLAYDFAQAGISYNILSESDRTCEVNDCSATGKVSIPATIDCNGTVYTVTRIGPYAFSQCTNLTAIEFPGSLTSIEREAFSGCSGLTTLDLPSSITNIGYTAFGGCIGLTAVVIPNSVTGIESYAFQGCINLCNLFFEDGSNPLTINSSFRDCPIQTLYLGRDLLTGGACFGQAETLKKVTMGNTVTQIGASLFSGCTNLTSIKISNSVTTIGDKAFANCPKLHSITIGTGVQSISNSVLFGSSPEKVIWLCNTPPSGYSHAAGEVNYVANESFKMLDNALVYPYLSSIFETGGIRYVPISSERTCAASTAPTTVLPPYALEKP